MYLFACGITLFKPLLYHSTLSLQQYLAKRKRGLATTYKKSDSKEYQEYDQLDNIICQLSFSVYSSEMKYNSENITYNLEILSGKGLEWDSRI